ncbi:MAG TPA: GntR family transcriptional regulator [Blastocatellia bacterium]|nr:GntR family transcriptional regulator [Blastocatellia bacterium]
MGDMIRDAVSAGTLKPRDRLAEGKLAKELGVGLSPGSDALCQFEQPGLVTRCSNRGTVVTQLRPTEVNQIF